MLPLQELDGFDLLQFDALISDQERMVRDTVRGWVAGQILTHIEQWAWDCHFPRDLVPEMGGLDLRGEFRHEAVSLAKRNNVWVARECARLAREIHGSNGIVSEYPIMHHLMNMETVSTYEGTHDIHTLVLGQYLTGLPAFEPSAE